LNNGDQKYVQSQKNVTKTQYNFLRWKVQKVMAYVNIKKCYSKKKAMSIKDDKNTRKKLNMDLTTKRTFNND
jgi:hypothetical protein